MQNVSRRHNYTEERRRGLMVGETWVSGDQVDTYVERFTHNKPRVTRTDADKVLRSMIADLDLNPEKRHRLWAFLLDRLGM